MNRSDRRILVLIRGVLHNEKRTRENHENISLIIMLLPPAWILQAIVAGCLFSDVSRYIRQGPSVRWALMILQKKQPVTTQWTSSCGSGVQILARDLLLMPILNNVWLTFIERTLLVTP